MLRSEENVGPYASHPTQAVAHLDGDLEALRRENGALRRELAALRHARAAPPEIPGLHSNVLDSAPDVRRILDHLFAFVGVLAPDGTFLDANRLPLEVGGLTLEDVQGKKFWDCYWWNYSEAVQADLRQACARARQGEQVRYDVDVRIADGHLMPIDFMLAPLVDEAGTVVNLIPSGVDISARKEAEMALRESEARLRTLFSSIDEGYCLCELIVDAGDQPVDYQFIEVNPRFETMTGLAGATGRTALELVPDLEAHWVETYARVALGGESLRFENGSDAMGRWFDVFATPVEPRGRFALVFKDVTERRRAEQALRESEERFRATFAQAAVGISHVGLDGSWLRVNERLCQIIGYSRDELLDLTFQDITHPDDLEADLEHVHSLLSGETDTYQLEKRYVRKDGHLIWTNLTVSLVRNGETGAPQYFISVIEDITGRKEAEQALSELTRTLEQQVDARTVALTKANRMLERRNRELQDFAHVASHDLKEPLRKISTFASLLRTDYGERLEDDGQFYVERLEKAAVRMSKLITELLSFSRLTTQERPFAPVDLNGVTAQVLEDLNVLLEETAGTVEVGPLPTIHADSVQMQQLLQNLIGNALKFHPESTPPCVRVTSTLNTVDGHVLCRLIVEDNGIGFDEKYVNRIFSPFQRLHTRAEYEGTGMGLAICRRIAEHHGGAITAESTPGEGSRFVVTLPAES